MATSSNAPPARANKPITLHLTADAERRIRQGHPWVYDRAIVKQRHDGSAGALAAIYDRRERFVALGLYDPASPIRVRILQRRQPAPITVEWFDARLREAIAKRASLLGTRTTGYRLVHGENDGLPGLVIDRYDTTAVIKLYTIAWAPHLAAVLEAFSCAWPCRRVVVRLARAVERARAPGLPANGEVVSGPALTRPVLFQEHGLTFEADVAHGHKTGFFLDQRDNRARVERLTRGRAVLDAFAYTGACSVYAARGGATDVLSLERSAPALEVARRQMGLNRKHPAVAHARHEILCGDTFETLERFAATRRLFDVVVLDPPAFAKTEAEVSRALAAYTRLTRLGLGVLKTGGALVASSCSSHVSAEVFFTTVRQAASRARRRLRELERTGHPVDHPVTFSEGAYLKCLFAVAL